MDEEPGEPGDEARELDPAEVGHGRPGRSWRASPCRRSGTARSAGLGSCRGSSRAACRPSCIAAGATPGHGLAVLRRARRGRRSTKTSGWPGIVRSGSTRTRPARSSGHAERPAERRRRDARRPEHRPRARSARRRRSTPSASIAVTSVAGPDLDAQRFELRRAFAERSRA